MAGPIPSRAAGLLFTMLGAAALTACGSASNSSAALATDTVPPQSASASPGAVAQVPAGVPLPLATGTVESPPGFEPHLSFTVPDGWFGAGDDRSFIIGKGLDPVAQEFKDGVVAFDIVDMPFTGAVAAFRQVKGISVGEPEDVDVAGHQAAMFSATSAGGGVGLESLGLNADINDRSRNQFLVDLGTGKTLLIRTEAVNDSVVDELAGVLASVRFAD